MTIGGILRERDQQYIAHRDSKTQTWRILDTWHDDLRMVNPDDDISDESEAVTIITEGGFHAVIREAGRLGLLENASFGAEEDYIERLEGKDQEIATLQMQLQQTEQEPVVVKEPRSEAYDLKEKAMEAILKLVSISDISGLSKE